MVIMVKFRVRESYGERGGRGKGGVKVGKDTTIRLQTFLLTAAGTFVVKGPTE